MVRGWSQNSFSLSAATYECSGFIHVTNEGKWFVSANRNVNMTVDTAKRSFGISLVSMARNAGSNQAVELSAACQWTSEWNGLNWFQGICSSKICDKNHEIRGTTDWKPRTAVRLHPLSLRSLLTKVRKQLLRRKGLVCIQLWVQIAHALFDGRPGTYPGRQIADHLPRWSDGSRVGH